MNSYNLSKRELETMNLLWEKDHSLTAYDIQKNMGLSVNSVQSTLRRLLEKDMIYVENEIVKGRVLARCYKPTICKKDYDVENVVNQLCKMQIKNLSLSSLTASFLAMEKNPEKILTEITELEDILAKYKNKLNNP